MTGSAGPERPMATEGERLVRDVLRARAGEFGLDGDRLRVERVLNWGGFVAESFRATDGARSVHLKLAADQAEMRRWLLVHDHLERHYRAPRILGWVDVPGTPLGGLAFDHIPGATWDPAARPGLLADLAALLGRLHADRTLLGRLGPGERTYRDCWAERYRDQFAEGLAAIRPDRPACVTDDRLARMEREAQRVLALPDRDPAFDGATRSPCHWDLWQGNVLVEPDGAWWVLDWDGLAVGDPAEDYATLLWPVVAATGRGWRDLLPALAADDPLAARVDRHLRAITLDYAIDILADWADCPPAWRDAIRPVKEAQHREFWDLYQSRHPGRPEP